jgi:ceramide glucosyltransferase
MKQRQPRLRFNAEAQRRQGRRGRKKYWLPLRTLSQAFVANPAEWELAEQRAATISASSESLLLRASALISLLFALDRAWKQAAVWHFFRRPRPADPAAWPAVSLLQPITRGAVELALTLRSRLELDYPAPIQHLLICDQADAGSQRSCRELAAAFPAADIRLILVDSAGPIASKIEKLQAALPIAAGDVLAFVDDDVRLRPAALRELLPYLDEPRAGSAFGLACYVNWRTWPGSAMSAFVNANALLNYIPLCYLSEPFTITGHCFALRREVFAAAGGLEGMAGRIDDDHELARRVRRAGLRNIQTPMIYDVDNDLPAWRDYGRQMQRWFVLPRLLMLPQLSRRDRLVTALGGAGNILPTLSAILAALGGRRGRRGMLATAIVWLATYLIGERRYLGRPAPLGRWPALAIAAIVAPAQIVRGLLRGDEIHWRGQRLRIGRDGIVEVL